MKIWMIKMMMSISTISIMMKTPISMGSILLIQTILTTMMMILSSSTSWFSMITFLMMIGGLLILFTYMSSIASNEKFKFNILMMTPMMLMLIMYQDSMMEPNQPEFKPEIINTFIEQKSMMKMYTPNSIMTIALALYLLITMIMVNKMVMLKKGPLRVSSYE